MAGGLILAGIKFGGQAFAPIIADVISKAIRQAANDPNIPSVTPQNRHAVEEAVTNEVIRSPEIQELGDKLESLTNSEPWYRSNVTWGAIGSIFGGAATLITLRANGVPLDWEIYSPPVVAILGGVKTLHGRWVARKKAIGR